MASQNSDESSSKSCRQQVVSRVQGGKATVYEPNLNEAEIAQLENSHRVSKLLLADKAAIEVWPKTAPLPEEIQAVDIQSIGAAGFSAFVKLNYYDVFKDHFTSVDYEEFATEVDAYFKIPIKGVAYMKGGEVVALVVTHEYQPHPALGIPTVHVGYWGYERALVTREEARAIKAHWLCKLGEWSGGGTIPVDVSIDSFNVGSQAFAKKNQFEFKQYRLDKRGQ